MRGLHRRERGIMEKGDELRLWGGGGGEPSFSCNCPASPMPPSRTMDFRTPDLLDMCLEPPEDVFSTGSFLELGLQGPPSEVPVTRLQEQGLQGWECSVGHSCVSVMNGNGYGLRHLLC